MGKAAEAQAALAETEARWDALLAEHGPAYAAHAVDFWLEDRPNPKKALQWAEANLKLRRDPGSLVMAARARLANGDAAGARRALLRALPDGPNVDEFHADVASVWQGLGELDKAKAAHARARALNPKTPALD
jgi:tetratricopeptide (TPR) repeat protein